MKFIVLFFALTLFAALVSIGDSVQRCVNIVNHQIDVDVNSFVQPGIRTHSDDVWYSSLTWNGIPSGPVTVKYYIRYFSGKWRILERGAVEIFYINYENVAGSIANLMRYALGIPKFSDIKLGEVKLDKYLFKTTPCIDIYTNNEWQTNKHYEIYVNVTTRQNSQQLMHGHLKVIEKS